MVQSLPSDAVREVHKYSAPEPMQDANVNPNLYDHIHMKLFRAQRNLYISGFSLFLWLLVTLSFTFIYKILIIAHSCHLHTHPQKFTFRGRVMFCPLVFYFYFLTFPVSWTHHSILRRVLTLLNQVAATQESSAAIQAQMDHAVQAARQHQDDNLMLKQVRISLTAPGHFHLSKLELPVL